MSRLNQIWRKIALAVVVAVAATLTVRAADTYPKHELRSVWLTTVWCIDWPSKTGTSNSVITQQKNEAIATLDRLKAAGFNAVNFQVRPMADRLYAKNTWTDPKTNTKYTVAEPWSSYVTGSRGTAATWDPLEFWIEEAHKRGMELHAWVNPYRMGSMTTAEDKAVADWIITYPISATETKSVFNPALSQTISRISNVCRVLTANYDIDGIVFDDYFYPDGMCSDKSTTAPDYANYQAYLNNGGKLAVADWRRDNVNRMVKAVYGVIKDIKPWVRFGISPAGAAGAGLQTSDGLPKLSQYCSASDWQYASIGSDPIAWLRNGSLDYISPQLYWLTTHKTNPFGPMAEWWSLVANKFGRHFFASHSVSFLAADGANNADNWAEVGLQVKANRDKSADGNFGSVYYSTRNLTSGLTELLSKNYYQCKATVPAMTWFNATDPGKVDGLALSGKTLSWTAKDGQRYIVYAVPATTTRQAALSTDASGLRAEYIVDVTYSPSLQIPDDLLSGYWYGVAVLDRYGNEWELATIGETQPGDDYVPATDPATYTDFEVPEHKIKVSFANMWIRNESANPVGLDIELHRDMAARYDATSGKDIVYIVGRSEGASKAASTLYRYDGATGAELKPLALTYDDKWNPAFYPANGIVLDDNDHLLTHTLALAGGNFCVAAVNPETGACTTMLSDKTTYRIDHIDVVGNAATGESWYVIAGSSDAVTRWTMKGNTVVTKEEIKLPSAIGSGARVHAINNSLFWIGGQGAPFALYEFGKGTPVAKMSGNITTDDNRATALTTFAFKDRNYLVYQTNYSGSATGIQWKAAVGADFSKGVDGGVHLYTFPAAGGGSKVMGSADYGAPVSVVTGSNPAARDNNVARVYVYSPGNTLAAYALDHQIITGIEDITADSAENSAAEWYNLNGSRINTPTTPGLYLRRTSTQVQKVIVR